MEGESVVNAIISDIETQTPFSKQTLTHFQTLLDDSADLAFMYAELSSRNLSPNALVSALSTAMDSGEVSLVAASVYLSLILAPNSPVFTLFTPLAFSSLLRAIRRGFKSKTGSFGEGSSQGRKKGRAAQRVNSDDGNGLDVGLLIRVLEKVGMVLGLVHLDRFEDSKKGLVQTVAEIPVMGCEVLGNSGGSYKKMCELCSRIFAGVLKAEHGDQSVSAAEVLKCLTPLILGSKLSVRSFGLEFVVNRMVRMGESSSEVKKAVVNLAKYLAHKAPERAEPRALAVECIVKIVKVLDSEDQVGFADYVVKMSQGVGKLRLLAVDLILALMMSLSDPLGLESGKNGGEDFWGFRCLEALYQRCSDVTATIRAKALNSLAQLVELFSKNDRTRALLEGLMGIGNARSNETGGGMENLLKRRCLDEKAAVRKAALFLISKLIALSGSALDGDLLKTVGMACSDPLLSIRKAALSALSEVFRLFPDANVTKEWLHSVPRLISDHETGIQEECENLFSELVLDRVCEAISGTSLKDYGLGILRESCVGVVIPWIRKICASLGKKKKLKPRIITALQTIITQSESLWLSKSMPIENWVAPPGAWFLLAEVSAFLPKVVDWEFLVHHWQLFDKHKLGSECQSDVELRDAGEELGIESHSATWAGDRVFLLQAISNVAMKLPPEPAADLAHNILTRIQEFDMHSTEVNAHVKALRTLCTQKATDTNEVNKLVKKWADKLLSDAVRIVEMYLSEDPRENQDTFLTPDNSSRKGRASSSRTKMLLRAITAVYTIGSLVIVYPSANLKSIVPVLHTIITSGNSDPKTKILLGSAILLKNRAPSLYIQAWVTMGKICLADGDLAKRYIPLFMQELENSELASLRNNIVVAMADFCVRHTALVDCYMPKITKCLRDPCEVVRRQTFILLARLLQRDYVKWRGLLFLRFLLSLVDESEEIRRLADFLFGNILKVKAPLLAYNSFVEAIFTLNDCDAHTGRSNPPNSKKANPQFCIRGNDEQSRSRRLHIYVTLLKQMTPEHLLTTFAKVCAEILAAAADGLLNINDPTGQSVLQDAFQVLCSKEIRFSTTRQSTTDSLEPEEDSGDGGATKGKLITQALKKSLIQNAIPIFIELKRLLESKNSPLIGSLMECLRVLLKDYKSEIDEILVADKQLQKELIYDMQKYESMKARSAAAEAIKSPGDPRTVRFRQQSYKSPVDPRILRSGTSKVASAMADAAAATRVRSVLKEVNNNAAATPPLSAMSAPKLKSRTEGATARGKMTSDAIDSVRRRYSFSDEES